MKLMHSIRWIVTFLRLWTISASAYFLERNWYQRCLRSLAHEHYFVKIRVACSQYEVYKWTVFGAVEESEKERTDTYVINVLQFADVIFGILIY